MSAEEDALRIETNRLLKQIRSNTTMIGVMMIVVMVSSLASCNAMLGSVTGNTQAAKVGGIEP